MNAAVEAHNVEVDGLPVRYLSAGEGPPLMLLHGAGWGSYNDILYRFLDHVRDVRVAS